MEIDLDLLNTLITKRTDEIEQIVAGTGYLPKTVIGVGTFLLDNEGDVDLLTAKQRVTFEKFLKPLLERQSSDQRLKTTAWGGSILDADGGSNFNAD